MDMVDIRGYTVSVGRDFVAKAGDRLLIVNGVCLGVYTAEKVVEHAPKPPKAVAKEGKPKRVHKSKGPQNGRKISQTVFPTAEAVVRLFDKYEELTPDILRVTLTEELRGPHDWKMRDAVLLLKRDGRIVTHGSRQAVRYTLAPQPAAAAA